MSPPRTPPVELDFLGLRAADRRGKNAAAAAAASSIRGMETSAIARIHPGLLRRVIAGGPPPPPPEREEEATAPMTLFYNGSVAVFDVPVRKAEGIMRMATEAISTEERSGNTLVGNFAKDIPLARTKSLHRFMQKRKERLTRLGPYDQQATTSSGSKSFHVKKEAEAA